MTKKSLQVYLNDKYVGDLSNDNNGGINFSYSENNDRAISLSLPLRKEIFPNNECNGFFNGLLPESENTRIVIGKKYGISPKNDFSILKAIGYDCAGAVSFFEDTPENELKEYYDISGKVMSDNELETFINELPQKPLAIGVKGMRLSLAGAQDKTAVILIDNKIALPDKGVPSTHILKPSIQGYNETVENEYICLKTAKELGINVPNTKIMNVNNTKFFLIERYDREIKDGKLKRLHQEDFCQASNIVSAYKYQSEGGVDFKQCFEILRKTSRPAIAIKQFTELMVFNYLIGNNDAHGKNFSILYLDSGRIELAPAYDILCSTVYTNLSEKMSMKIGGHYEHDKIMPRHFEKLADEVGISYTQLRKIIKTQCENVSDILRTIVNSFENTIGKDILTVVETNCERTMKRFEF